MTASRRYPREMNSAAVFRRPPAYVDDLFDRFCFSLLLIRRHRTRPKMNCSGVLWASARNFDRPNEIRIQSDLQQKEEKAATTLRSSLV